MCTRIYIVDKILNQQQINLQETSKCIKQFFLNKNAKKLYLYVLKKIAIDEIQVEVFNHV
jgi:hypothetical protein